MKFLCDSMLGKLTRWLRLLGKDSSYYRDIEDEKLLEIAKTENRILITRDKALVKQAQKRDLAVQQITGIFLLDQLREVIQRWKLATEIIPDLSRCSACNGVVTRVKKRHIQGDIPEGTFRNHNEFWKCTKCGKIYWKGAHWEHIKQVEQLLKQNQIVH